jgi:hypothetical protein
LGVYKGSCTVERRARFVEYSGEGLEYVRHAGRDVEGDLYVVDRGPGGKAKSVAQQDLVRPDLDEK